MNAPYILWKCDEGGGDAIESTPLSEHAIKLDLINTGGNVWTNPGWLTFDGNNYFEKLLSELSAVELDFISPKTGVLGIWLQVSFPSPDIYSGNPSPITLGSNTAESPQVRARLNDPGAGSMDCRTGSGNNDRISTAGSENGARIDETDVHCWIIDNRDPEKSVTFLRNQNMGNGNNYLGGGYESIDMENFNTWDVIRVGSGSGFEGAVDFPFIGQIRNICIAQFADLPSPGIDKYLQDVLANNGLPEAER